MRGWSTLTLTLALAATIGVAAQTGVGAQQPILTPLVTSMGDPSQGTIQGTYVGRRAATAQHPEMVTLRFDWNGVPVLGTYAVNGHRWMANGERVNWNRLQQGTLVTVPNEARLVHLTFGGAMGVGTITNIDRTQNTVTVRLPSGESRVLRHSPQALFVRDGRPTELSQLSTGNTVLFEVVPGRNEIGLFHEVAPGTQATITQVGNRTLTVQFMENGQLVTRTYAMDGDIRFVQRGQAVLVENLPQHYRVGETVWVFGPSDQPQMVLSGVNAGFEQALYPQPGAVIASTETTQEVATIEETTILPGTTAPEVAAAPEAMPLPAEQPEVAAAPETMPAEQPEVAAAPTEQPEVAAAPDVTLPPASSTGPIAEAPDTAIPAEQPEVAVAPEVPAEPSVAVAGVRMAPPFEQGTLVSYVPATADSPAVVTMRFNWNGTPLLGTFPVRETDAWMYQGQPANFAQIQPGAVVDIPQTARLDMLTFGGAMGVGTVTAINRTQNTVTLRLPSGEMRTLRHSPQSVVLSEGMPAQISSLQVGQTVMFEVVPDRNMVALFTPVEPGLRATVTQASPGMLTVQYMQNGQMVSRSFSSDDDIRFFHRGHLVTDADFTSTYRTGDVVWIFGPADEPQFVASGVQAGFETALVTPTTTTQPASAVAGTRQAPTPAPVRRPRPSMK